MLDLRPLLDAALGAFAVVATVTPPAGAPVQARVFWLPPETVESPSGADVRVVETRRSMVLSRAEVPSAPRGTVILIPEFDGAAPSEWEVDSVDSSHYDHLRVTVVAHG